MTTLHIIIKNTIVHTIENPPHIPNVGDYCASIVHINKLLGNAINASHVKHRAFSYTTPEHPSHEPPTTELEIRLYIE